MDGRGKMSKELSALHPKYFQESSKLKKYYFISDIFNSIFNIFKYFLLICNFINTYEILTMFVNLVCILLETRQ